MRFIPKKIFNTLIFFVLATFFPVYSFAQEYTVTNYTVDDGLPQSTVYSILEDNNGYLWFSSYGGGVSKFDGSKFTILSEDDGLASNQVYSIFQDLNDDIWFGTRAGISIYNGYTIKNYDTKDGLKNNNIRCITQDANGVVWVGTYGGGISKFENNKFTTYTYEDGLTSDFVYDLHFDQNNIMWIGTKEGVCSFDHIKFSTHKTHKLINTPIRVVTNDSKNNIWVGSQSLGVAILKSNSKIDYLNDSTSEITNEISDIFIDTTEKQILIATLNNGLYILQDTSIVNYNSNNSGLKSNIILSITKDSGGDIWLGTYGGGATKLSKTPMHSFHREAWIDKHSVRSMIELENNNILFGLREGGIKSPLHNEKYDFLRGYTINTMYQALNLDFWIGTNDNGIFRIQPNGDIQKYDIESGLSSNKIFCIEEGSGGEIWFGTYDAGIILFKNEEFKKLNSLNKLNNTPIYDLHFDKTKMWIATNGDGVFIFKDGFFYEQFEKKDGLCSNDAWTLKEDVFGNIWIGSNGGGISMYNGNSFSNFSTSNGLASNNIHSLLFDEANNLWVGSEQGIDRVIFELKDTLGKVSYHIFKIEHYRKEEGMYETETNLNSSLLSSKGNLWFGTISGVTKFNPKETTFNTKEPIITLTNIKLFFQNIDWKKKYNSDLEKWSGLPKKLNLQYTDNHLTFEYAAITSHYSNRARYKVKLMGFDENWSSEITESSINYPNLPSGDYTFMVIACNENDIWTTKPAQFSFSIRTPIYKMPAFYIFIILFIIASIWFYIRRRDQGIRLQNLKLEQNVLERTKELREEKNHVELQNIEIVAQKRELETKKIELETKNTEVLDSINYAKRLQKAIITSEDKFQIAFKDFFIFFSPKDIVSGDFQWLIETPTHTYMAAVDCTGHGVPGAFMSIVCNRLLNLSVKENEFKNAALMLKYLHDQLLHILERGIGEDSYMRDGMDLALCIINKETKELSYAGAHNPLIIIRNEELITFEADRKSLGFSMNKKKERSFTEHQFQLQSDDQLYVFSDGFSDQFGGSKKQKYYYLNFEKLLLKLSSSPMDEQYINLVNEFLDWKGEHEQIDDVLVIGVKIK